MNFEELTSYRECGYEGVDEFLWRTEDVNGWGKLEFQDGPLYDWIVGHKHFLNPVRRRDTVIQAGGCCGMYPRFYSNYFKNVYTFEPDPLNFYCLDKNCEGDQFHKFEGGLGYTTDKLTVENWKPLNCGSSVIKNIPGDVQMYRIDDLNLTSCDLIHLDVEGFEPQALMGGLETIKKFKPAVILENARGADILKGIGYDKVQKTQYDVIFRIR